jgi:hypothetical protein
VEQKEVTDIRANVDADGKPVVAPAARQRQMATNQGGENRRLCVWRKKWEGTSRARAVRERNIKTAAGRRNEHGWGAYKKTAGIPGGSR